MQSSWRFLWLGAAGVIAGGVIGTGVATYYVAYRLGLDLQTLGWHDIWFIGHLAGLKEGLPDTYHVALLITGLPALLLCADAIGSNLRTKLTDYDDSHFQTRRELKRNKLIASPLRAENHTENKITILRHDWHDRRKSAGPIPGWFYSTFGKPRLENRFLFGKLGKPRSNARYLGGDSKLFPHVLLVGPTNSGKSTSFVIPNLLTFSGSAIVLDVKGELFEATSRFRQDYLGNKIWYFAPFNRDVESHGFNPLARIKNLRSKDERFTAINMMMDVFVVPGDGVGDWYQAAKDLFIASCLYVIENDDLPTIGRALEIMEGGGNKKKNFLAYAEKCQGRARRVFLTMADVPEDTLGSYISVLRGAGLGGWSDPAIEAITTHATFDFRTFRKTPQTLYILVPDLQLKLMAPVVRLLFGEAIASLEENRPGPDEPHQVMMVLDEFDQLGRQQIVLDTLKTIRGYGGRYFFATQSIAGLEGVYGLADRRAIQAGAGVQIYLTPQDDLTGEVLSKALGKETVAGLSESMSSVRTMKDSSNVSRKNEERALISESALRRFPKAEALVLLTALEPIRARRIISYEDRYFKPIEEKRAKVGDALRGGISWRCSRAVNSLLRKGYATCQRLLSPNYLIHRVLAPTLSPRSCAMGPAS